MKKIIILLLCFGLIHCSKTDQNTYTINGKLMGVQDNTWIRLTLGEKVIDSTQVVDNTFLFTGSMKEPEDIRLRIDGVGYTSFWLENSQISFSAEAGKLDEAIVRGSKTQLEEDALQQQLKPFDNIQDEIDEAFEATNVTQIKKDSLNRAYKKSEEDYFKVLMQYVKEHPSSLVGLEFLDFYKTSIFNKNDVQTTYEALSENLKNHPKGKSIARFLAKSEITIGDTFADILLKNTQDKEIALSQNLGEYTLVSFWTSSCSFCRANNPRLVKIYKEFQPKGFQIFGVSFDRKKSKWLKAVQEDQLPWNNVVDLDGENGDIALQYKISAFPDNILIDKEGKVIARDISAKRLHNKLTDLLN